MFFKNLLEVDSNLQLKIREWRNHIDIRKHMYNDQIITIDEHNNWLNSLTQNKKNIIYVAFKNEEPIGIASINNIKLTHKTADWAFYLSPDNLSKKGLGTLVEYHFLNFIFDNYEIEKLNCEVLATNPTVISLHKKFGFKEEGIRRKNIIKDGQRINIYLMGILKDEWLESKNKFNKIIERLEK